MFFFFRTVRRFSSRRFRVPLQKEPDDPLFTKPTTVAEQNYNLAHCRTRVVIEKTFGILKRRFACLNIGLRVEPEKACKIIMACVILHNFGIAEGDIIPSNFGDLGDDIQLDQNDVDNNDGKTIRNVIANTYFA